MTAGGLRVLVVAGLGLGGGCIADFDLGEDTETDGTVTGGTNDPSASSITLTSLGSNSGTSSMSTSASTSTTDSTSSPVTTEPPTTTTDEPTTESPTTVSPTTGGSTTETPLVCGELGYEDCVDVDPCMWVGDIETGNCEEDPCFDFDDECLVMDDDPKACLDAEACSYWEAGASCRHHMCWPCHEIETAPPCEELVPCVWNEGEGVCVHVD